jgi:hypothetical protein
VTRSYYNKYIQKCRTGSEFSLAYQTSLILWQFEKFNIFLEEIFSCTETNRTSDGRNTKFQGDWTTRRAPKSDAKSRHYESSNSHISKTLGKTLGIYDTLTSVSWEIWYNRSRKIKTSSIPKNSFVDYFTTLWIFSSDLTQSFRWLAVKPLLSALLSNEVR